MSNKQTISISSSSKNKQLHLEVIGELTRATAQDCLKQLQTINIATEQDIHIHFSEMNICDSIGLITLHHFVTRERSADKLSYDGLNKNFQSMWDATIANSGAKDRPPKETQLKSIERLGKAIRDQLGTVKENLSYLGETLYYIACLFKRPKLLRLKKVFYFMREIGPGGLPLALLIGVLFGVILTFQSVVALQEFGAEIFAADLVSISLFSELGPLLTAIIITGRSASAYAAEISAMKVNQEVDALEVMGMDAVPYLILPRIIAAAFMAPLLNIMMIAAGLFGCLLIMLLKGYSASIIFEQMFGAVNIGGLIEGLFKATVFGVITIAIGCIHGINCQRNATAVGKATTATVVRCIVIVTVMDGLFATTFYFLGL